MTLHDNEETSTPLYSTGGFKERSSYTSPRVEYPSIRGCKFAAGTPA